MDRNWRFALGHAADDRRDFDFKRSSCLVKAGEARGAAGVKFDDSNWRQIDLPHDWAIELPLDPRGDKELAEHGFHAIGPDHPETSVGWYRRHFRIPKQDLGRRIWVEFDGVFRDSIVWINGHRLGQHQSGYTSFHYDLTDYLNYGGAGGGGDNVLALRVDASSWEGWWYEGAGIYRHVWLTKMSPLHVALWGTFVTSELKRNKATITVRTTVANDSDNTATFQLSSSLAPYPGRGRGRGAVSRISLAPWTQKEFTQSIKIAKPDLWSPDSPNLYVLHTDITQGAKSDDTCTTTFGIRTTHWDPRRGFFLNGKRFKIQGTCNHRDHAGVGVALSNRLHQLRIEKLKELGCNAFRCSHYPHAPELLDACDRLGMLVMAENRLAGSSPQILGDFESMIRRDRNHPSIILWSLANEEHTIQWSIAGERIGRTMVRLAHKLDPTREVTAAMHDKGLAVGFANIVDVHGWNYIKVGDIDAYHRKHPDRPIVGSEEASTVCTRGIYADDPKRGYVSAYDIRTPGWGSTAEKWWTFFSERPWLAGGFVWTGFDYRGEPIPYKWPCTASHFGIMDLCGFPKDNYYYYKSWWTNEPVLHLFPHWNWRGREGETIDVRCFTNCEEVELFVNGHSHGRKRVVKNSHVAWNVPYQPGTLESIAFQQGKEVLRKTIQTSGSPKRLIAQPDRQIIRADGEDVVSVTVSAQDDLGHAVPTANNLIEFNVSANAKILGVGNGDPSSYESDKAPRRRLFNGLALVLIQSTTKPGPITITATSRGLSPAQLIIPATRATPRSFVP